MHYWQQQNNWFDINGLLTKIGRMRAREVYLAYSLLYTGVNTISEVELCKARSVYHRFITSS